MGKTRLALQVLEEVSGTSSEVTIKLAQGLESCSHPSDLIAAISKAIGAGAGELDSLKRAIGAAPTLLLLDNLDSLKSHAPSIIGPLLDHCPGLQILVTSLVPIGMEGEVHFELGQLVLEDAVALYQDRVHRAWADRIGTKEDGPAIEELVRRLDRIPLAIELAAARVRVLPPRALLSRISERFELLQSNRAGRHGSLYQAVALTWDLLDEEEQLFLARASVFVGGFSLEAAEAVLGDEAEDTLGRIADLRSKALLQVDESSIPRYAPYESVRDFAALQLEKLGLEAETIRRHAAFFLEEGSVHVARVDGPGAAASLDWIEAERENLIAAHKRTLEEDPAASARLGLILGPALAPRGLPISEISFVDSVLGAARRSQVRELLAAALRMRGLVLERYGRGEEARANFEEGLSLLQSGGPALQEGFLLADLGRRLTLAGEIDEAFRALERALEIGRAEGSSLLESVALGYLGGLEEARGNFDEARVQTEESLQLARRHGHLHLAGRALTNLGVINIAVARYREARHALQEARAIVQQLGDRFIEAPVLVNLGVTELAAGRIDEAEVYTNEALAMVEIRGNRRFEAAAIGSQGVIALVRGELELAEERIVEAVAALHEIGDRNGHALLLSYLSVVESLQGREKESRRSWEDARTFFEEIGDFASLRNLDLIEGIFEAVQAKRLRRSQKDAEGAELEARARERMDAAVAMPANGAGASLSITLQLLERALSEEMMVGAGPGEGLVLGPDAAWFRIAGAEKVDLHRRRSLRRLLMGLAEQRVKDPGVGLTSLELFRLGWVGEDIGLDSAAARVYTGIWTLRSLGLGDALVNKGDGYMLHPELPLSFSE